MARRGAGLLPPYDTSETLARIVRGNQPAHDPATVICLAIVLMILRRREIYPLSRAPFGADGWAQVDLGFGQSRCRPSKPIWEHLDEVESSLSCYAPYCPNQSAG